MKDIKDIAYMVLGAIILIAVGAWVYFYSGIVPQGAAPAPTVTTTPAEAASSAGQTSDAVKTSMPSAVGKTNPFKADVNPVSGYQNPFE